MKYLLTILCFGILSSSGVAQTMKSLMYNTNGVVVYTNTNALTFTNAETRFTGQLYFGSNYAQVRVLADDVYFYQDNGGVALALNSDTNIGNHVMFYDPLRFHLSSIRAQSRTNLGLGWPALTNSNAATSLLGFDTNGQVVYSGTNVLTFTNSISFAQGDFQITESGALNWSGANRIELETYTLYGPWTFDQPTNVRASLGFSTNLNTLWTSTNTIAARQALGLQSYTNTLTNSVGDVEIGSTVNSVTIGWMISPTNATYALRQLVGSGQTNTITNNSATLTLTSLELTNNTTWTLTVGDGSGVTNTATASVNFYNYMSWGRSTNTTLNNAAIQTLHTTGGGASRAFATSRSRSFTMDGGGQYIFIAYPAGFGSASFTVGGLPNTAFTLTTNTYTNASGYVTNYLIYRTDTIQNGSGISFVVQ